MARSRPKGLRTLIGIIALVVSVGACSATAADSDQLEWGEAAATYFDSLSEAYRSGDFHDILDFYEPSAYVEKWRGDNRGGSRIPDALQWNSGDLSVEFASLHLGEDQALAATYWPNSGDLGVVVSDITRGRIAREVAFDLGSSLVVSLRATPELVASYESLHQRLASAWNGSDGVTLSSIYAPDAVITDVVAGLDEVPVFGLDTGGATWSADSASEVFPGNDVATGPAVFVGPSEYGVDPERAIGIYRVEDEAGCGHQIALVWTLAAGLVTDEHRFHEPASLRMCEVGDLPTGWWTGLELPLPADQVETGVVVTADGASISVRNGTDRLEDLLQWGIARFTDAGLDAPKADSVTFEPSRSCVGRSGRVVDDGEMRRLYVCMFESELCTLLTVCDAPATRARLAMVHELAHAWMIDNVDSDLEDRVLAATGRVSWDDPDLPWPERGVEFSADVIAWGLIDEDLDMVRIGSPPCQRLHEMFALLTDAIAVARGTCPG